MYIYRNTVVSRSVIDCGLSKEIAPEKVLCLASVVTSLINPKWF